MVRTRLQPATEMRFATSLAVVGLAGSGAYITVSQMWRHYPPDFDWPNRFEAVNWLGLLSVAFLVIQALIDVRTERHGNGGS